MSLRPDVEVAIVGVGQTTVGNLPGQHSTGLYVEAAKGAIEDCGIDKSEIDGLLTTASVVDDNVRHHMVIAEHLGLFCKTLCDCFRRSNWHLCAFTQESRHGCGEGYTECLRLGCANESSVELSKNLGRKLVITACLYCHNTMAQASE